MSQHNIAATGVERAQQDQKKDTTMTCTTAAMANAPKTNVVDKHAMHSQERVAPGRRNVLTTNSSAKAAQRMSAACVNVTTTSTALARLVKSDEKNTIGITVATTAKVLTNVA